MYKPIISKEGTGKWGLFPFIQRSKEISNGQKIGTELSGCLLRASGATTVSISTKVDGVSFVFSASGGSITVSLPSGEQTIAGDSSVTITDVASLTRSKGVWVYAGK